MHTAVVIATYNEAENVSVLIEHILANDPAPDILIVDDGSPDGTGDIVDAIAATDERVRIIHRAGPRGYGPASREGLSWCLEHGYEAVVSMDADLSHDPSELPELIAQVAAGADLAIGSRYTEGGATVVDWGPMRRAVSKSGSAYARLMLGTKVRDCTSGYRCYKASSLATLPMREIGSDGYCFLIELLAMMVDRGFTIVEVPITYVDRRAGSSKISRSIVIEAFARATGLGMRRLFARRGEAGQRRRCAARPGRHRYRHNRTGESRWRRRPPRSAVGTLRVAGDNTADGEEATPRLGSVLRNAWFVCVSLTLCVVGVWLRLLHLGVRFDREGTDEGIYWQTLRAMASGHAQCWRSSPPMSSSDKRYGQPVSGSC